MADYFAWERFCIYAQYCHTLINEMNKKTYEYQKSEDSHIYFFVSNGIQGEVNKVVLISQIEDPELNPGTRKLYNLAFGHLYKLNDEWVVSDKT